MTRADGIIAGTDTNIVDGLPVYNACVVIKGSYAGRADAQHYKGQFPKVLVEGHIDVVNPEELPKSGDPSIRIKLQPYAQPVVATPEELAAIPDELSFDARGRVVENDKYATASKVFANAKEAEAGGGVRIYVPGYGDMMPSTSNAFVLAAAMKKHNIKPVYDIWICGTAGEEGKGNLAGVKQLYGFDQKAGTGSNPLNIVANFGLEGGGTVNFVGSYRFEMKFKAPSPRADGPSAPAAMAAAIAKIADVKTPSELRDGAPRTTYTVGRASCEPPPAASMSVPSCSLEVDMRSTRKETLDDMRKTIEPMFQAGVSAENARHGRKDGSDEAISLELMWFGLRPAFVADSVDNVAVHAGLQSGIQLGAINSPMVGTGSGSLNDNVPAQHRRPDLSIQPGVLGRRRRRTCVLGVGHARRARHRSGPHASRAHGGVDRVGVPRCGWHRRATIHRPDWQADARSRSITLEHPIMKRLIYSLAFVVGVAAAGTPAFAQQSGGLRVEFQGPGGHSSGAYGRVSALHAAARAVILIQKALPAGSYQITNLTGGNSVNSIASDGLIELKLTAANAAAYQALVTAVTKAAAEGAAAENAFRGVKTGDLTSGAPATVRSIVTPF